MLPRAGAALMEDCLAEALQQRHDGLNGVGRPSDHDGEGSVARADIAFLDEKLKGPVYLVANPNAELPNLLPDLRGQVNIQLRGVISSKRGGIKTVLDRKSVV